MTSPAEVKAAITAGTPDSGQSFGAWLGRTIRRDPAVFGMPALLIAALLITVAVHPSFSDFDLQSLAMGALPLAFAAAALTAVVNGGVSLTGGRGGIVGPVIAAFVLTLIPADLIFLNIDPNFGQVIQGTLIVAIVMIGGFLAMARARP